MYFTDRGIEELADRRGDEQVSVAWLAERLRDFVDLNPGFETAVDRLASWLARLDDEEEDFKTLLPNRPVCVLPGMQPRRGWLGCNHVARDNHVVGGRRLGGRLPGGALGHSRSAWRTLVVIAPASR